MKPGATVSPAASIVRAAVRPVKSAHRGDLPLPDRDIADVRRVAGAIDDPAAANHQIEILRRRQHPQLQQEHPEFHNASVHRLARTP